VDASNREKQQAQFDDKDHLVDAFHSISEMHPDLKGKCELTSLDA